jgi:succinate dehydrogenase hydrophobic anchor subunit
MRAYAPKAREGTWLWLLKIIAGALIIVILGVHFVINHMAAPEGLLTYADIVRYYQIPYVVAMEFIFVIVVVVHAFLGLRSIILDLNPSESILKVVDVGLTLASFTAIVYGIWLLLTIAQRGAA